MGQVLDRCLPRARDDTLHVDMHWSAHRRPGSATLTVDVPARTPAGQGCYSPSYCAHVSACCSCAASAGSARALAPPPPPRVLCHCHVAAPRAKPTHEDWRSRSQDLRAHCSGACICTAGTPTHDCTLHACLDPVAASRSAQAALEAALERERSAAARAAAKAARLCADAAIAAVHAERQQQEHEAEYRREDEAVQRRLASAQAAAAAGAGRAARAEAAAAAGRTELAIERRRVSKLHTRLGELEAAVAGQAAAAERGEGLQRKLAAERVERAAAAMDAAALRRQLLNAEAVADACACDATTLQGELAAACARAAAAEAAARLGAADEARLNRLEAATEDLLECGAAEHHRVVHENAELAGAVADLNAQLAVERERCNCLEGHAHAAEASAEQQLAGARDERDACLESARRADALLARLMSDNL